MTAADYPIGSKARIVKNGDWDGNPYYIDDICIVTQHYSPGVIHCEKDGREFRLSINQDSKYGVEVVPYIEETLPLYKIY